jgi:hypothetical protein
MPMTELESSERELTKLVTRRTELQTKLAATETMFDEVRRDRARAAAAGRDTQQFDKRGAEYLALTETLSDAVREADLQISLSENALADQRDFAAREGEITTIREMMAKIEAANAVFIEAAHAFRSVSACSRSVHSKK